MQLDSRNCRIRYDADSPAGPASGEVTRDARAQADAVRRVLVIDADDDTLGLLHEWLTEAGYEVRAAGPEGSAGARLDAVIVDVAYPRESTDLLCRVAAEHPGTPLLALSPTFFASVECTGRCARSLGVAGVLPKPVRREALLEALQKVARRAE